VTDQPSTCPAATWAGLTICATCPTPEPGTACAREPGELLRAATDPSPFLPRIRQAWVATDDAGDRLAALNADPERFRRIVDGQQRPNTLDLALIATACRVTVDWLISGKEPRLDARTAPDNPAASNNETDNGLRDQLMAAIASTAIRIKPDSAGIVDAMLRTGSSIHLTEEEAEPIADAVMALRDSELQQTLTSARVASALHRSAEDTVTRVIELTERWIASGPPPLGTLINRWWDRRLAELRATITDPALDGPADTTPPAEAPSDAPRCPRCGDSLTDYEDDDLVYRVGDQRPYCSGDCVVRAHREALKEQGSPDTCRPVQVGGETIRVHGARPLAGLELGYAAEIVAAARRKLAAEPPVVRADDGTESALTRRIRAQQRGLALPAAEPPDDSVPPVPCPACTRARSRGFTVDSLAHPGCADALATQEPR
jgi:hypothetical protein